MSHHESDKKNEQSEHTRRPAAQESPHGGTRASEASTRATNESTHAGAHVHVTAVVEPHARLGEDTEIWHFCHVRGGADIGARCILGKSVYVGGAAKLGEGVRVQNNVSIYDGVTLDDDVFVGPSAVFTNVINPRAHVPRKDHFMPTQVCRGATVGANATIICGTTLGEFAFVGAGSVVTRDVPAFALVVGNPARQIGWACQCGEHLPEPDPFCECDVCGARYELHTADRLEWTNRDEMYR